MSALEVEEQNDLTKEEAEGPKLNMVNYANGILWAVGVIVACVCQFVGIGGKKLPEAMATKVTILSPAHGTWDQLFLVWIAIFCSEGIFVLAQFGGAYRQHKVVQNSIGYKYAVCLLLQITYFFLIMLVDDNLWIPGWVSLANFVMMMLMIASIEINGKRTFFEFWFLRAPFSLHAGYLLCDAIAWLNIFLQERPDNASGVLIATSMTGVTAVLTLLVVIAIAQPRPDGLFCFGVAYTYYFVARELYCDKPPDAADTCYAALRSNNITADVVSNATLLAFHYAATSICFIAACFGVLAWGLRVAACMQRGRVYA